MERQEIPDCRASRDAVFDCDVGPAVSQGCVHLVEDLVHAEVPSTGTGHVSLVDDARDDFVHRDPLGGAGGSDPTVFGRLDDVDDATIGEDLCNLSDETEREAEATRNLHEFRRWPFLAIAATRFEYEMQCDSNPLAQAHRSREFLFADVVHGILSERELGAEQHHGPADEHPEKEERKRRKRAVDRVVVSRTLEVGRESDLRDLPDHGSSQSRRERGADPHFDVRHDRVEKRERDPGEDYRQELEEQCEEPVPVWKEVEPATE